MNCPSGRYWKSTVCESMRQVDASLIRWLRIPGHADQRSGVMAITIPRSWRSRFRADADQKAAGSGMLIAIPGREF